MVFPLTVAIVSLRILFFDSIKWCSTWHHAAPSKYKPFTKHPISGTSFESLMQLLFVCTRREIEKTFNTKDEHKHKKQAKSKNWNSTSKIKIIHKRRQIYYSHWLHMANKQGFFAIAKRKVNVNKSYLPNNQLSIDYMRLHFFVNSFVV